MVIKLFSGLLGGFLLVFKSPRKVYYFLILLLLFFLLYNYHFFFFQFIYLFFFFFSFLSSFSNNNPPPFIFTLFLSKVTEIDCDGDGFVALGEDRTVFWMRWKNGFKVGFIYYYYLLFIIYYLLFLYKLLYFSI